MESGALNYTVSAPGKVILFGEHSVVYKKAAVSTSISRRLYIKISSSKESTVCVKFPATKFLVESSLDTYSQIVEEKCPLNKSGAKLCLGNPEIIDHDMYVQSLKNNLLNLGLTTNNLDSKTEKALLGFLFVFRGMCQVLDCALKPFSLEVLSELEIGAGTGSSAAFSVAVSGSILNYIKYLKSKQELPIPQVDDNITIRPNLFSTKSGFSIDELRIINKWSFCVEKIMHGRPSGIDNTTSTFGSVVVTKQDKNKPGELSFYFLDNVPEISILLISTGVSRNTSNLVTIVRQLRENNPIAVDGILNAMDIIALEAFKLLAASADKPSDNLFKNLSGLMYLNHGLLRTLGVSHESLERIVNVTSSHGLTSKLTGAGGGGYAISLVPPNISKTLIEELKKELGPTFTVTEINIAEEGVRLENHAQCN